MSKDELKRYEKMGIELRCLKEQIEKIRADIESPGRVQLSNTPKGRKEGKLEEAIARLVDLEDIMNKKAAGLVELRIKIEDTLDGLYDPLERTVLRYKYIDGLSWDEVSEKIGYEWRQTFRIHSRALENLG